MPHQCRLPTVTNDQEMEVGGRSQKMLDFQRGLYGAGRVTPQVTATWSPPCLLLPGPRVTTSSSCSGYQARDACTKHNVVSLDDFSHTNNRLFLTLYLSKTEEETPPSSFPQLSIKYVLPLLLFLTVTDFSD